MGSVSFLKVSLLIFIIVIGSSQISAQCSFWTEVPVNLGNDTTICAGADLVLDAGAEYNYEFYSWSTGQATQSITVNTPGQYIITTGMVGSNLVVNGDFSAGATGFTSGYVPGTGGSWGLLSVEGTYAAATSPSAVHTNFLPCTDHTTGTGNMLVVNGAGTPVSLWCQTITVTPNTDYLFSTWITNALNDPNVAQLQFSINGVDLGTPFTTTVNACEWVQFNATWNSGSNTSADICIINQNTSTSGNDFAIDDISFYEVCTVSDTIDVQVESFTVDAGPDLTYCPNALETITATSDLQGVDFSWSSGETTADLTATQSGTYTVTATSQLGCTATDDVDITVTPMNWGIDTVLTGPTACGQNNGYVSVLTNGTFDVPPVYTWSGPGPGSSNQINASVFQNLSPGWYYLTIVSDGCIQTDSAEVTITNPPQANLTAIPSTGVAPLTVDFTNGSSNANSYYWDFGDGNVLATTSLASQQDTYTIPGVYTIMLVAEQGGCSDTAYVQVIVNEPPVILPLVIHIPNVFTPDGDKVNDVFTFDIQNAVEFDVQLFNRWGNMMFTSNDPDFEWDGKVNGNEASQGTYFYIYHAVDMEENKVDGHGFFELLRSNH